MSKVFKLFAMLLAVCLTFGCFENIQLKAKTKKTETETVSEEETAGPVFDRSDKVIYIGKSFRLRFTDLSPEDPEEIVWTSSDEDVATVENGRVTGISEGKVYIYAEYLGNTASCLVKVKAPCLSENYRKIRINNSFTLTAKGTKAVSFSSSKKRVASVSKTGEVTAKSKGNAVISCLCENGETYTCEVEVYLNVLDMENPSFSDLAPTTRMSFEELVGDNGIYDELSMMPKAGTYRLVVDLYHKVVMAYTTDENGEYTRPVRYMLCGVGASASPTPTGTFKMENYRLRYERFNGTDCYGQYWSILTGRIYFHSLLYNSFDAKDYTVTSYDNLGKAVSHGCIRLTVPDARWIYYNVAPGTEVEVRKGSASDKETASIRKNLVLVKRPSKRPNLKMGQIPETDNWTIQDVPQEEVFVQGSQNGGEAAY